MNAPERMLPPHVPARKIRLFLVSVNKGEMFVTKIHVTFTCLEFKASAGASRTVLARRPRRRQNLDRFCRTRYFK
jgi:hypothetical protein